MTKKDKETILNIYTKLQLIQSEIKELIRTEENKFQKYKFFNELQVLKLLRPLLEKYKLTLLLSDDISQPFIHEREGKEHFIKYLKKLEIVDSDNPEQRLLFNFWACGSNVDLAKAKGSSETYAIKYMLSKFFLMPVKDEGDPDYRQKEEEKKETKENKSSLSPQKLDQSLTEMQRSVVGDQLAKQTNPSTTISMQQVDDLTNLLRQKNKEDKENQAKFFQELDDKLAQQGVGGATQAGNFKMRFSLLSVVNYQYLYNWLLKLDENK